MNKILIFLSLTIVSSLLLKAQAPAIEWQKSLGGSKEDYVSSISPTQDGKYFLAGSSASNDGDVSSNHGYTDSWIVKIDAFGTINWQKNLGGIYWEHISSIVPSQDGGCVVAGYTSSNDGDVSGNHGENDFWIIKLDSLGNIIWQRLLGGSYTDVPASIISSRDGGYVVAGFSTSDDGDVSVNQGFYDLWVVKLDSLGTIIWQKSMGGSGWDEANSVFQSQDGGYVVAGSTSSDDGDVIGNHGWYDFWIVKLDSMGATLWQKCLGGGADDFAKSIIPSQDGGYVVVGNSNSNNGDAVGNNGWIDVWVVKLDAWGDIVWQKCLGGSAADYAESVIQTEDGGYVMAGYTQSNDGDVNGYHGGIDTWIVKLDALGVIIWQKCLGGSDADRANSILLSQDGGYMVVGWANSTNGDVSGNHGGLDSWIVKLGPDSNVITGAIKNALGFKSLTLYPNPAADLLILELEGFDTSTGSATYQIFDLQGRLVLEGVLCQGKNQINIASLSNGSYVVKTGSASQTTGHHKSLPFEVVR